MHVSTPPAAANGAELSPILEKAAALEGRSAGRLARLAVEARSGALDKVVKAIEEMVVTLKQEKQDEVAHRDFCVRD